MSNRNYSEQLSGSYYHGSPRVARRRRSLKKFTRRIRRQLERMLLEDTPQKVTHGWAD